MAVFDLSSAICSNFRNSATSNQSSRQRGREEASRWEAEGRYNFLGLQPIEESHSNETSRNLLGAGSAHLCRDRLGTGHKKRLSRHGGSGARVAPSTNHSFNRGS